MQNIPMEKLVINCPKVAFGEKKNANFMMDEFAHHF